MNSSLSPFCEECGAANSPQATYCFACYQVLDSTLPVPVITSTSPAIIQAPVQNTTLNTSVPAGPLLPGFLLAQRYIIISQIGHGGFGVVYKAKDIKRMRRLVAVKQINLHTLTTREIIEATDSYNREVQILTKLKHRNLPRIYDRFTDPDHWYLVMDYIKGVTLEDYLSKQNATSLPVREVLKIGIALCEVLTYLHTQNPPIIFRDVKPSNIMRTPQGHLYLIDFGIARQFKPGQKKDTGPLGSPGYAAPEQYGKAQTTMRTDIYGLGVTLKTLLTGNDPLETPVAGSPAKPARKSHFRLHVLLNQMVEWDSEKRPKNMNEVRAKLLQAKEGRVGVVAKHGFALLYGLLLGSIPYSFFFFLSFFGNTVHQLSIFLNYLTYSTGSTILCSLPLFFVGQLIAAIVLVKSTNKRRVIMGIGIITMLVVLFILFLGACASGSIFGGE